MRVFNMFNTAVCVIFLIKLRWPKTKSLYDNVHHCFLCLIFDQVTFFRFLQFKGGGQNNSKCREFL